MKVCCKCKEEKDLTEFGKCKTRKDGHQYQCKQCRRRYRQENKDKIREKDRRYYQKNREKISEQKKLYYQKNREKISEQGKRYQQENKDKIRERKRRYRQENKDKISEQRKLYRQNNKDKIRERKRRYREVHRERIKEVKRLYRQRAEVKEANRLGWQRRRARKLENGVENFTHEQLLEHWISTGIDPEKCFYCDYGEFEQIDHYIPISKGGPHHKENLRPACARCNLGKHDKLPEVWLSQQQQNKCIEINQEQ